MGGYVKLVNYRDRLEKLNGNFVILNDLDPMENFDLIKRLCITSYDGQTFSLIPSCSCGITSLDKYPHLNVGDRCTYCHTQIAVQTSRPLEPIVWIRAPEGVDWLINPEFLSLMLETYKEGNAKYSVIHWLLDPLDDKSYVNKEIIEFMKANGVKRGMRYFYEHTEEILTLMADSDIFHRHKVEKRQLLALFQKENPKGTIFTQYLPLPHKSFNVVEKSQLGSYVDMKSFTPYMNAVNAMLSLNYQKATPSISRRESVTAKTLFGLESYYADFIKNNHNKKKGKYRQHIYASRLPWTARMVITSIHVPHDFDEMWYPWGASIGLFEVHLTSVLLRRGYTPNEVSRKLLHAVSNYDKEIDEIFEEMIASSPHRTTLSGKPGLMIVENRNPSLKTGSMQQVLITKIKKDVTDISKSYSVLILGALNGDKLLYLQSLSPNLSNCGKVC